VAAIKLPLGTNIGDSRKILSLSLMACGTLSDQGVVSISNLRETLPCSLEEGFLPWVSRPPNPNPSETKFFGMENQKN
jgi:hypothetical protein